MTPVATAPHLDMPHGKAWLLDMPAIRRRLPTGHQDAAVAVWLVEAPWAHPVWHSYSVSLIHLRPLPGLSEPTRYLALATHELIVSALDPDGDRDRLLAEGCGPHCRWLLPANFAAQMVEVSDELASARVRDAVERICRGTLSPDTDFTAQWVALFGDNMMKDRER